MFGDDDDGNEPVPVNPDPATWDDPTSGFADAYFHRGAGWCMRSKLAYGSCCSGQQCCYDKKGNLITKGKAAGTADKIHPGSKGHYAADVQTYNKCKREGKLSLYWKVRPINQGSP